MKNHMLKKVGSEERGQVLIFVLVVLLVSAALMGALMGLLGTGIKTGTVYENRTNTLYAADAGIQDAISYLNSPTIYPALTLPSGSGQSISYTLGQYDTRPALNGSNVTVKVSWFNSAPTYKLQATATKTGSSTTTTVYSYVSISQGTGLFKDAVDSLGAGGMHLDSGGGQITGNVFVTGQLEFGGSNSINGKSYETGQNGTVYAGGGISGATGSSITNAIVETPPPTQTFNIPSSMNSLPSEVYSVTTNLSPAAPVPPATRTGPWTPPDAIYNNPEYVSGDMTFPKGTYNVTFNGPVTITGTLSFASASGTIIFNSTLSVGSISIDKGSADIEFNGSLKVDHDFTVVTGGSTPVFGNTIYIGGNFTLGAGYNLTFPQAVYINGNMSFTNGGSVQNSTAAPNAQTYNKVIVVNGSILMIGGTSLGTVNQVPLIVDTSSNSISITLDNGANDKALIYAPNAAVSVTGGASLTGSVICNSFTFPGNGGPEVTYQDLNSRSDIQAFTGGVGGVGTGLAMITYNIGNPASNPPGPAAMLAFNQQPSNTTSGNAITPAVTVMIEDASGNTVTTSTAAITLAIGTNPGGGTLSGTFTQSAVNGVATFSDLSLNKSGTGYTLIATSTGLTSTTSGPFNVTGVATKLVFTTQPSGGTGGTAFGTQPVVSVEDASGNVMTASNAAITLTITSGTGANGATLSANTNPVTASNGVATFGGVSIDKASANSYTLTATSPGLTSAISNSFNISFGTAVQLGFNQQPTNATSKVNISPAVTVVVQDAGGNTVTTSTASITIAIGNNAGSGTLFGTLTRSASSGVATFNNLNIDKAGIGYTLTASSGTLSSVTSSAFNITAGTASQLVFTTQPSGGITNTAFGTQPVVTVEDASGNTVTTSSAPITLAISTNPGSGTLTVTTNPLNATNGVAVFSGVKINNSGIGYTLRATSSGLTSATSNTFNVTGPATKLVFGQQPGSTTAGANITPAVTVTVQDASGNTVTSSNASITIAIGTNPGGGTLSGIMPRMAVNGVATFPDLSINKPGTGYKLIASSGTLTSATSDAFNITVGAAAQLVFTTQPSGGTGGTAFGTQPAVTVEDAGGNVVTTSTAPITLTIGTNAGSGTLSGTATINAVSGVATFNGISIDKIGTGYTLIATSGTLTSATSNPFNITVGAASKLAFGQQPSNTASMAAISPAVTVTVQDAGGNTVTSSTASVVMAISNNAGSGTLSGTLTVTANSGIATFNNLSIDKVGTGYTLKATSGTLTLATSAVFNITPGAANAAKSTLTPTSATILANGSSTQVLTVTAEDASGNILTTGGATITITKLSGTGTIGGVTDNGNGTYSATVTAPTAVGSGVFVATLGGQNVNSGTGSQTQVTVTYVLAQFTAASVHTQSHGTTTVTPVGGSYPTQSLTIVANPQNGNYTSTIYCSIKNISTSQSIKIIGVTSSNSGGQTVTYGGVLLGNTSIAAGATDTSGTITVSGGGTGTIIITYQLN